LSTGASVPGGPSLRRPDHENELGESRSAESHVYQKICRIRALRRMRSSAV
jgi:hypothetical protein